MTLKRPITLVGAPAHTGAPVPGCLLGPDAIRSARLAEMLQERGHDVRDIGNVRVSPDSDVAHPNAAVHHLGDYAAWTRELHDVGYATAGDDAIPIFLGGDHSIAAGTVSGVARQAALANRPQFLLWLDAHTDFHTLDSTESGNLHGTPLAYLSGEPGFADQLPSLDCPIDPANICLMGIRSVDPGESARMDGRGIEVHDMASIATQGVSAPLTAFLERVRATDGRLHVSLDVDFLDPDVAPAVGTAVPGGPTYDDALTIMDILHQSALVTSLDVVELNPLLDEEDRTAQIVAGLVAGLFGGGHATTDRRN